MKLIYLFCVAGIFASCNSADNTESTDKKDADSSSAGQTSKESINCYRYATGGDTVMLKLVQIGEAVTGTLVYKLKEKDKNEGTFQGTLRDSLVIADYTFQSEGVSSIREVAFKRNGNSLVEGYGSIVERDGKTSFKSLDSLDFSSNMKLAAIPCQ